MGILHPSLFFINFAVFGKILWLTWLSTLLFDCGFFVSAVPIMLIYWSLLIVGRILDEILFFPIVGMR